ncbi:MAG: hypothetical protein Q8M65_09880, partial [Rhodoglobus sp.]|nr:hypothetical protein [Rhodoglobus sp.]
MSDLFDIFRLEGNRTASGPNPYRTLGYERNPFRPQPDEENTESGPFYGGHIQRELGEVQRWMKEVHTDGSRQPLSLVGNIGVGKSRILRMLRHAVAGWPVGEKAWADLITLTDTGYARASVGGLLLTCLERMQLPDAPTVPD